MQPSIFFARLLGPILRVLGLDTITGAAAMFPDGVRSMSADTFKSKKLDSITGTLGAIRRASGDLH